MLDYFGVSIIQLAALLRGGGGGAFLIVGNKNKEHMLLLRFLYLCENKQPPFRVSDNMMCSCVSSGVFMCLQLCVHVSPVMCSCVSSCVECW